MTVCVDNLGSPGYIWQFISNGVGDASNFCDVMNFVVGICENTGIVLYAL